MEFSFLLTILVLASLVSGLLTFFLKRGMVSAVISFLAPVILLIIYALTVTDEFGFGAVVFSLGLCACLMGAGFGIVAVKLLGKK